MHAPRFLTRFAFWLLLGLLSTFFAEFLSGSAPGFLLGLFGYVGIFPIYCLHSLALASLMVRFTQQFSLRSLYFASLLFGMYEAYTTKVLWEPSWNPDAFRIAKIAVFETTLLVFFWHAVISFMIPLFIGETLLTDSRRLQALLPMQWQARTGKKGMAIGFGLIASVLFATEAANLETAARFALLNCGAVTLAILAWRTFTRKKRFDLTDLLPRKGELVALVILLLATYITWGSLLNRHVHPGISGHAAILLLYIFIIVLTALSIRRDRNEATPMESAPTTQAAFFSLKHWFVFCSALLGGSILVNLLPQSIQNLLAAGLLVVYTGAGVFFLGSSIYSLLKRDTTKQTAQKKINYD